MNPNRPYPDDDQPTAIEQRLKRLQPLPVELDAVAIMAAAAETKGGEYRQTTPTTTAAPSGIPRWLGFAATWSCGAVAGVLVTLLVLWPTSGAVALRNPENPETGQPANIRPSDGSALESGQSHFVNAVPRSGHPWSHNEWIVSSRLIEMDGPGPLNERPLMAGNYAMRFDTSPGAIVAISPSSQHSFSESDPIDEAGVSQTLSTNPDRLLRELLGDPPTPRM